MDINYAGAGFWFSVGQWLFAGCVAVYAWWCNRTKANKEAIQQVYKKYDELRERVLQAEGRLNHLPDQKAIGEIHYRIDQVGQGVSRMEGQMEQMNNTLQLVVRTLMEDK